MATFINKSRLFSVAAVLLLMLFGASEAKGQVVDVTGRVILVREDIHGNEVLDYPENVLVLFFPTRDAAVDFMSENKKLISGTGVYVETDENGRFSGEAMSGSYLVVYHPETGEDPKISQTTVSPTNKEFEFRFEGDVIEIGVIDVVGKKKPTTGIKPGRTRVYGDTITFNIDFYLEEGLGGDNKRLIVQPYVISCEDDTDTISCLTPILLEGIEYHTLQNKRKDYNFTPNDPLHKYYLSDMILTEAPLQVRKTVAFKRPNPEKYYYCVGKVLLADYTHIVWSNEGDTTVFGSCFPIEPLKFLEFNTEDTKMPLDKNKFYERPENKIRDVNQNLQLLFVVGTSEFTQDSINVITTQQLADELKSYGASLVKVDIIGTSSPDGGFELNNNLAKRRASRAWDEVSRYVRGNHFQRSTESKVYTWIDVADSLQAKGFVDESNKLRETAVANGEYSRMAQSVAQGMDIYESVIEPILDNQRAMTCTYYYQNSSPLTPDEAIAAWYDDPRYEVGGTERFTNGDYFNILSKMNDPVEERKVVERAYKEITKRRGYQHYAFPAYIANRMALYKLQDGEIDTMILKPFIDMDVPKSDQLTQISFFNQGKWIVNRREILATQALMYLKANKLNYSDHLIQKLPETTKIKTDIQKYYNMIMLVMHWDDPTLSPEERNIGMDALYDVMEASKTNEAILKSELCKELELEQANVLVQYVDKMPDSDPRKWYLKGMLISPYIGQEDIVLAKANTNLISLVEAFKRGVRANDVTMETYSKYRALTADEEVPFEYGVPPYSYAYDSLVHKFDSLSNVVNARLKTNKTPYFLAYFQHCFDLKPEFYKFFAREGNIEKSIRMKHPYKKEDIKKYREKFEMLEPEAAKAYKAEAK